MTASPDDNPADETPAADNSAATPPRRTHPGLIALAVAVVAVPLAWGVSQTVFKSTSLFHHGSTTKPTSRPAKGTHGSTTGPTTGPTTHGTKLPKHKK